MPETIVSSPSGATGPQQSGAAISPGTSQTKIAETTGEAKSAPSLPAQTAEEHESSDSTASQAEKPAAERTIIQRSGNQGTEIQRSEIQPSGIQRSRNEKPPVTGPDKSVAESSDPDLQAGLKYLQGDASERNSAEAVRYLWKSVQKQNGWALVKLAGLYANGDGVAKDCDQARILVQAAARHNIPNLEAALETLHKAGCE